MKTELIFLGPPACGKGTQTAKLAEYLGYPHIDTGSLLRAEIKNQTEAGIEAKKFIDKGYLVPVELVSKIIKNRLFCFNMANHPDIQQLRATSHCSFSGSSARGANGTARR